MCVIGCATTEISGFSNPNVDFSLYKKIAVLGNVRDIAFRKILEYDLANSFDSEKIDAIPVISIASPIKNYTKKEFVKIMRKNKIDALLSVEVISSSKETSYVQIGNVFSPVSSPQISFEIILKDVKSGKIAFKLTANSEGDSMSAISKSLAEKSVEIYMAELFDDSGVFE